MTTDELTAQFGYGDPTTGESRAEYQGFAPPPEPQVEPTPSADAITEEDLYAAFIPGYQPQSEPAAPQVPASPVDVTKQSGSVNVSSKGFSPGQYGKVTKATKDERTNAFNRIDQTAAADANAFGGMIDQSTDMQQAAAAKEAQMDADYIMAESDGHQRISDARMDGLRDEEVANAKAQALSAEGRARYQAAMEDARVNVNPNELFQSMSKGDQIGTLASVFVHDFLGAKGIKTSALDTLNKAIDRNIDAQIQNIKNKQEHAAGMKTLWEMQRAESSSDAEARARVRGIMMQAMEDQVAATLGTYRAGIADAKGQMAIAKLQAEKTKAMFEVYKDIDDSARANRAQEQQWIVSKMQNSIAAGHLALARAEEKRKAEEAKAKTAAAKMDGVVFDPSDANKAKWMFKPGVSKEQKEEVEKHLISTKTQSDNIAEYRKLIRQFDDNQAGLAGTRWGNTEEKRLQALQSKILLEENLRIHGTTVTDAARKETEKQVLLNRMGTRANVDAIAAGFEDRMYKDTNARIGQYTMDLPEGDARRQLQGSQYTPFGAQKEEAAGTWDSGGEVKNTPTDNATQGLQRPDATKPAAVDTINRAIDEDASPASDWNSYNGPGKKSLVVADAIKGTHEVDAKPPAYAVHMATLRAQAAQGIKSAEDQLKMYAGTGEVEVYDPTSKKTYKASGAGDVLPDGTDANSTTGKAMRAFAQHEYNLYELAKQSGVVR